MHANVYFILFIFSYSIIKKLALYQKNLTQCQKNLAPLKKIWHLSKKLAPIRKN